MTNDEINNLEDDALTDACSAFSDYDEADYANLCLQDDDGEWNPSVSVGAPSDDYSIVDFRRDFLRFKNGIESPNNPFTS